MILQPDQYPTLHVRALDFEITPEAAYPVIAAGARYAYWLDSAREESPMSRVSYVGVVPHWAAVLRIENAREATNTTPWDALDTALASMPEASGGRDPGSGWSERNRPLDGAGWP